jgi:hypothetical protein
LNMMRSSSGRDFQAVALDLQRRADAFLFADRLKNRTGIHVFALSDGRPHGVAPTIFCETEPLPPADSYLTSGLGIGSVASARKELAAIANRNLKFVAQNSCFHSPRE